MRISAYIFASTLLVGILAINQQAWAFLHPQLGRFVQRDPIGYVDGMNIYSYLRSNPMRRVDPIGTSAVVITSPLGGMERPGFSDLLACMKSSGTITDKIIERLGSGATVQQILDDFGWLAPWDIWAYYGHADPDANALVGADTTDNGVYPDALAKALAKNTKGGPGLIVLAGCESCKVAETLQKQSNKAPCIICFKEEVPNLSASGYFSDLMKDIVCNKMTIAQAFQDVKQKYPALGRAAQLKCIGSEDKKFTSTGFK